MKSQTISKNTTPQDQRSTDVPYYLYPNISGAIYIGVPQTEFSLSSSNISSRLFYELVVKYLARPKSANFNINSLGQF